MSILDVDHTPKRGFRSLSDIYATCNLALLEPADYREALKDEGWKAAMKAEIRMIEKNKTWELVDRPKQQKVIGVRWVFRTKLNPDGSVSKLKARLVVKGYS